MTRYLLQDLRFAARAFARAPRFTLPAVLALALGIGATAAIFSVVRGVILQPLPYADPGRVVSIWETQVARNRPRNVIAPANFVAWLERNRSFTHLGMVGPARFDVLLDGQPYELTGLTSSSETFAALGTPAFLGRTFRPEEDLEGADTAVVLSHEFWRTRLGARPDVIGSTLVVNGRARAVVGVMPPGFTIEGERADLYAPYGWTLDRLRSAPGRGSSHAIARLRDGVTVAQAREEMRGLMRQLEAEAPRRNTGWSAAVVPIHELTIETVRPALLVLSGAVLLVLLIACVNVANLLLARSTVRQRELALRTALGAARRRLIGQMMTESVLLGLAGGIGGLALAVLFHRGLLALVANRIPVPRLDQVALDLPVVLFTVAVALGTSFLFGLLPAALATANTGPALRDGGRHGAGPRARRLLGSLVVAEVALALVLLTGAGLLLRSFSRLQQIDPGFRSQGLLTARVSLPAVRYPDDGDVSRFFRDALSRIRTVPGVERAAGISFLPLSGPGIGTSFYRRDRPEPADGDRPGSEVRPVTPGYFQTMGMPLRAGRDFTEGDRPGSPLVAVVSETLVERHFPGEDPIGRPLHVAIGSPEGMDVEVVGVVPDVSFASLDAGVRPAIYLSHAQLPISLMTFVVRTPLDPMSLAPGVAAAVHELDPQLPLADVRTMEDVVDATLARPRAVSLVLAAFAGIALVLAAVGVYGVISYAVSQQTQEIGVRIALGATTASVFRLVLARALRLAALGVAAGAAVAASLAPLLRTLLFQIGPLDPGTYAGTALLLLSVAAAAAALPARRGTRIPPTEALRAD